MNATKPLLLVTTAVAAMAAAVRRRRAQAQADELWREATSDATR